MQYKPRHSFRTAFSIGVGAGILVNTLFRKLPPSVKSTEWFHARTDKTYKGLKQRAQNLKNLSTNLLANPIPDLYRATDSLTLSDEDLINASA